MAEGWLWLSMRMATAMPSPASTTPAFSPGPDQHPGALGGQAPQVQPGGLVRAVLAPHHRVEGQLEVVGLAPEDPHDLGQLAVGQPEGPVQRLGVGTWGTWPQPSGGHRRPPAPSARSSAP